VLQWQNGGHAQRRGFANHSSFCLRLILRLPDIPFFRILLGERDGARYPWSLTPFPSVILRRLNWIVQLASLIVSRIVIERRKLRIEPARRMPRQTGFKSHQIVNVGTTGGMEFYDIRRQQAEVIPLPCDELQLGCA